MNPWDLVGGASELVVATSAGVAGDGSDAIDAGVALSAFGVNGSIGAKDRGGVERLCE